MVYRVYVEKQPPFAVEATSLAAEVRSLLGVKTLTGLRILHRYDVEGISQSLFNTSVATVFSEAPVDTVHTELPRGAGQVFAVEYLPGQFDQRADSAAECIQLISQGERPAVRSAQVYLLEGPLVAEDVAKIQKYVVNPVEARLATLAVPQTLHMEYDAPPPVPVLKGFCTLADEELAGVVARYGLAMDEADLAVCRDYFKAEGRAPTLAELRVLDTYWSDHCRHTTFGTQLKNIAIEDAAVQSSYALYQALRAEVYGKNGQGKRPQTLMDLATIGAKALKKRGLLQNLDESDEINACSVKIQADNNGKKEDWLLLFKNETHNHPTEIEPFGGAATCIGGAIRDPLSGRGYVYGAMRVTGAGNPLAPVEETLPGKLPQRKLVTGAAAGYASYGNQVGLATGQVTELYHPGYVAKRMEIGAVLGAVPLANVQRSAPEAGDVVLLLGGRTGRDGIGGATGSSKAHNASSVEVCGAEVQKGNPPVERKLQRLFRNPAATRLIRRCNDFGAGGVAVAIGELADGLCVNLDAVPKKYAGLSATEIAISESQERMAVVVREEDSEVFMRLASAENLEATPVAVVTAQPRLVMQHNDQVVVNIARAFINSNGAPKTAGVQVPALPTPGCTVPGATFAEALANMVQSLAHCSQKGLAERFDATIGAGTLLMPFGGKHQLTPAQCLAMKLPVEGETTTATGMAFGFNPYISAQNPYAGAYLAVVESVAKLVAAGFSHKQVYLSFQEYFERLGTQPLRWGKPFASLLGALQAQIDLSVAAIGGKDSMSGSFEQLDVPPTLVSFAVAAGNTAAVTGNEFRLPGSKVLWVKPAYIKRPDGAEGLVPQAESLLACFNTVQNQLMPGQKALAVYAVGSGGVAEALFKMGLGNRLGFAFETGLDLQALCRPAYGSFVVELAEYSPHLPQPGVLLGETQARYEFTLGNEVIDLAPLTEAWQAKLEPVLPYRTPSGSGKVPVIRHDAKTPPRTGPKIGLAKPRALVPVFPGTNCEYDTARALRRAGATPEIFVVRNLTPAAVAESAARLAGRIEASQMLVLPGGFSGGDEPEGSAKLIAAFLRGPAVAEALTRLLEARDGLVLGICNGFQALVKLGLLPHGKITPITPESPTLTFNTIGRHQSMLVRTQVASNLSPWLAAEKVGSVHTVAISHGEGRFVAPPPLLQALRENGQIATQYIDLNGAPTLDVRYNPNGSAWAIEGISSPDGRVLGKMGHTERSGENLYKNVPGNKYQRLFEGGVQYFML